MPAAVVDVVLEALGERARRGADGGAWARCRCSPSGRRPRAMSARASPSPPAGCAATIDWPRRRERANVGRRDLAARVAVDAAVVDEEGAGHVLRQAGVRRGPRRQCNIDGAGCAREPCSGRRLRRRWRRRCRPGRRRTIPTRGGTWRRDARLVATRSTLPARPVLVQLRGCAVALQGSRRRRPDVDAVRARRIRRAVARAPRVRGGAGARLPAASTRRGAAARGRDGAMLLLPWADRPRLCRWRCFRRCWRCSSGGASAGSCS